MFHFMFHNHCFSQLGSFWHSYVYRDSYSATFSASIRAPKLWRDADFRWVEHPKHVRWLEHLEHLLWPAQSEHGRWHEIVNMNERQRGPN